jgi:hypothetical protein
MNGVDCISRTCVQNQIPVSSLVSDVGLIQAAKRSSLLYANAEQR